MANLSLGKKKCFSCFLEISKNHKSINCLTCGGWFHARTSCVKSECPYMSCVVCRVSWVKSRVSWVKSCVKSCVKSWVKSWVIKCAKNAFFHENIIFIYLFIFVLFPFMRYINTGKFNATNLQ
jgi:hypothetical protein